MAGLEAADPRPGALVSSSAIGWYGHRGDEPLDESAPAADDFLAQVCAVWEREAAAAERLDVRVARIRTGVVLDKEGGALAKMLPFFKLGGGGPVAGGRQYMSWIHVDDLVSLYLAALDGGEGWSGPINGTAPSPVTNKAFSKALGRALHRPAVAPVPGFAVRVLYGEMADIVIHGQRVLPSARRRSASTSSIRSSTRRCAARSRAERGAAGRRAGPGGARRPGVGRRVPEFDVVRVDRGERRTRAPRHAGSTFRSTDVDTRRMGTWLHAGRPEDPPAARAHRQPGWVGKRRCRARRRSRSRGRPPPRGALFPHPGKKAPRGADFHLHGGNDAPAPIAPGEHHTRRSRRTTPPPLTSVRSASGGTNVLPGWAQTVYRLAGTRRRARARCGRLVRA